MKKIKRFIKPIGITTALLFIYILTFALLNYYNIISVSLFEKMNFVITILFCLFYGVHIGKRTERKGYKAGLKYGGILFLVFLLLNIILIRKISFEIIAYYIVLPLVVTTGSILGINLQNKKK